MQYGCRLTQICRKRETSISWLVRITKVPAIDTHNTFYFVSIVLAMDRALE